MWNTALDTRWDAYVLDIHDIFATTGDLSMPVGDPFCRFERIPNTDSEMFGNLIYVQTSMDSVYISQELIINCWFW